MRYPSRRVPNIIGKKPFGSPQTQFDPTSGKHFPLGYPLETTPVRVLSQSGNNTYSCARLDADGSDIDTIEVAQMGSDAVPTETIATAHRIKGRWVMTWGGQGSMSLPVKVGQEAQEGDEREYSCTILDGTGGETEETVSVQQLADYDVPENTVVMAYSVDESWVMVWEPPSAIMVYVRSKKSGQVYYCYPVEGGDDIEVEQVQISSSETIPPGTAAIAVRSGETWYMQVPIWL